MAELAKPGLLDLEKELTCSICTEVLYQPLTLLDCLHTFCGSCLKEWFSWQASQASASRPNPFTCPSCRASVREARPNANVTTLLELYLQANPGKARTEQEKEGIKNAYTVGENVLPKIRRKKESAEESQDRRAVEEARELSLREVGIRPGGYERGVRHRARDAARASHTAQGEASSSADDLSRARQIEHQSSLRSILSSSDLGDSTEMEEEILRQIMDEGILDGIDLNNLDISQEDELSEKIADAYRRRHLQRSTSSENRAAQARRAQSREPDPSSDQQRQRRHAHSSNSIDRSPVSSHPPVSRPHLLAAYPTEQGHGRRASSENRRQTSPTPSSHSRASLDTQRQAARSATDLSDRPRSSETSSSRPRDTLTNSRRTTDPERLQPSTRPRDRSSHNHGSRSPHGRSQIQSSTGRTQPSASLVDPQSSPFNVPQPTVERDRNVTETSQATTGESSSSIVGSQSASTAITPQVQYYSEPSVSCQRCGKPRLVYDLHWNCVRCEEGKYNICQRCYRTGKGCLHWYGFGYAAVQRYERQAPSSGHPPNAEPPHRLVGHRYLRAPPGSLQHHDSNQTTTSDPVGRLQSGPFCSNCEAFSPSCYWQCSICNEGEWGFCNNCVNQGQCCTHALLPVALNSDDNDHNPTSGAHASATTSPIKPTVPNRASPDVYTPIPISTHCDNCTYPVPPSTTRFHCPECNNGDYDLCTTCYQKFVKRGVIAAEDGPKGWRRCPNGHRMIIVGFEDSSAGQRRLVVEDLVGGQRLREDIVGGGGGGEGGEQWSWREGESRLAKSIVRPTNNPNASSTDTTNNATRTSDPSSSSPLPPSSSGLMNKFPPSGGIGMRVLALWSYWPLEGVKDELGFPKGAEIRECEDINGDWFWGVYCGGKGLFPGGYGRVVG